MYRIHLVLLLLLLGGATAPGQDTTSIDLRGRTAFRTGDDDVWRSRFIDEEEGWNFIRVPGAWERSGFPLTDGFAWYRFRFRIPESMRGDSLLLVMSGVDDADETFLNGVMVGKTGAFPPDARSELHSLRVYPLPRFIREEYNLLAVRVFDMGNEGGITGSIIRIIRADSMHRVLDEIVDTPPVAPPRFISSGTMVSAVDADSGIVRWTNPHLFSAMTEELETATVLSGLAFDIEYDDGTHPFVPAESEYVDGTGIYRARSADGIEVYWYHPLGAQARVLVAAVRPPPGLDADIGLRFVMERPSWRYEERSHEHAGEAATYHILAYNSCCTELVDRDMEDFLENGARGYTLEAQMKTWRQRLASARFLPDILSEDERLVYRRSVALLLQAQVRENGMGTGQIVSALHPPASAVAVPANQLLAAEALATAGLHDAAEKAITFFSRAEHGAYTLYDVLGEEHGVGYPYLVSPARYYGGGAEWRWQRPDDAILRYDGMPRYILALEALRAERSARAITEGRSFSDSAFIAPFWPALSARVADVIMYRLDSSGLIMQDDSPWGAGLSDLPGAYTSVLAVRALRLARDYAVLMDDDLKGYLYGDAAGRAAAGLRRLARGLLEQETAEALTALQQRMFHPLIADAVSLGIFEPGSPEAALALDIVERGFAIEDSPLMYRAEPGGDWFARQARPQLALRLARAYATAGDLARAERLFSAVTARAVQHDGLLPELVEPVSGNWHGGIPHIATAADYILTAERIAMERLARR